MYRIKRFGVLRTSTVVTLAYVIVFAILFVPLALISLVLTPSTSGATVVAGIFAVGIVVFVIYPLMIWIFTALACLVYNLAARWVGGIEVEIERPPTWTPPAVQGGWPQSPGPGQWTPLAGPGQMPAGSPVPGQGPVGAGVPGQPPSSGPWSPPGA